MTVFSTLNCSDAEPEKVLHTASENRASAMEWDDFLHVQPGHTRQAADIYWKTTHAGLKPASLISSYILGSKRDVQELFMPVLDSAFALHAQVIRIKAPAVSPETADYSCYRNTADELRTICDLANIFDIDLQIICCDNTLSATAESCSRLIKMANCRNLSCSWQPCKKLSVQQNCESLEMLMPYIGSVFKGDTWDSSYDTVIEQSNFHVPMIFQA